MTCPTKHRKRLSGDRRKHRPTMCLQKNRRKKQAGRHNRQTEPEFKSDGSLVILAKTVDEAEARRGYGYRAKSRSPCLARKNSHATEPVAEKDVKDPAVRMLSQGLPAKTPSRNQAAAVSNLMAFHPIGREVESRSQKLDRAVKMFAQSVAAVKMLGPRSLQLARIQGLFDRVAKMQDPRDRVATTPGRQRGTVCRLQIRTPKTPNQ